jgi:hypothetical protein
MAIESTVIVAVKIASYFFSLAFMSNPFRLHIQSDMLAGACQELFHVKANYLARDRPTCKELLQVPLKNSTEGRSLKTLFLVALSL